MNYDWLKNEKSPQLLVQAVRLIGTKEIVGPRHNPIIMDWAKELGLMNVYKSDEIPWCGLFMAICAKRAGVEYPSQPLWALNWAKYGTETKTPMMGDVLTFKRNGGGHVGIYVGEDKTAYHVLGGNQSDQVCVTRIAKTRLHKARRTAWKIAQPANVRVVKLSATGGLSTNEA